MVYRGGCGSRLDDEYASPSVTMSDRGRFELEHRGRSDEMAHFVGLDVSVKETSVCVVDAAGTVILEQKVTTEPADIITLLTSLGVSFCRIGIEAGPLSQWLVNALTAADLPVICVETRHMKALLTAQQINKTDRNDARGIAQMMRVGLFKPVHVKTLVAQEQRMLLTSRKLLQRKLLDLELDLGGPVRNFGLKVGVVGGFRYEARVRELVAGFPRLAAIAELVLNVRQVMRQQFAVLHKMLLDTVRGDPVCRRLMTAPGVGAVVALTYRATVDQPQRFVHSRAVARGELRPDRDRGRPAVAVAGQCVDGGRAAGDLRRDAAHEGFTGGTANQQDGPQRCARDRADDAGRPVQAGACEDAGCPGTADAADQPQAASTQAAGPGARFTRHVAQLRFESRRRRPLSIRGADPRARRKLSCAGRNRRAAARRPPGHAPAARRPAQDAARHGPKRPGMPAADDRPRGRRRRRADLPCDGRPAATFCPFPGGRRACRPDAEALPVRRDRL